MEEGSLLLGEGLAIYHLSASGADTDVMEMVPLLMRSSHDLIPRLTIPEIQFPNQSHLSKESEGAVDGRQTYIGIELVDLDEYLLSAKVPLAFSQDLKDSLARAGYPVTVLSK